MSNETVNHIVTVFPIDSNIIKTEEETRGRVSIIKEFSLNTSTHGVPGIARSRSIGNCLFWMISLLIFAGLMVYFVVRAITEYFEYPTQTSVTIIVEWPQAFPAVTLCNYSPLRFDLIIGPFLNYTNTLNLTNTTDINSFTQTQSTYIRDFLIYKFNQNESVIEFFYSLDSMMIYCDYNGIPCSAQNFTWFLSAVHGLCYTFNARLKDAVNDGIRYNADNGGYGVLNVRFFIHQHQYVPFMSYGSGMIATVHDNAKVPTVEQGALLLGPGQHHRLSYTKKKNTFLPAPYTRCSAETSLRMRLMLDEYNGTNYGYSQYECYIPCMQAYSYQKCGCINPFRWTSRVILLPDSDQPMKVPFCQIENPCYGAMIGELMNEESIWKNYCPDCQQECASVDFMIKSSSLLAPPEFYLNDIKNFVESSGVPLTRNWSNTWITDIQSNYVSLEVAYETTRTEVSDQQPTTSPVDVVSNVGGQTGLWIGISFLSLLEVVELLYRLFCYECSIIRRVILRRSKTETTDM